MLFEYTRIEKLKQKMENIIINFFLRLENLKLGIKKRVLSTFISYLYFALLLNTDKRYFILLRNKYKQHK